MAKLLKVDSTSAGYSFEGFFFRKRPHICLSFWNFERRVFGLSLNGSRQFSELQFMCPQISFVGKNFFLQYRIVSKIFLPLFHKNTRRFSKLHLACSGEKFEVISFVLANKKFCFSLVFLFRIFIGKPLETKF